MEEMQPWFYMTGQLYFSLRVKYQPYGYTRLIADGIRRAPPGCIQSPLTSQRLCQQATMALTQLWHCHSISMFTPCKRLHFMWRWTHLSYTFVQLISYGRCFCNAIWQCNSPDGLVSAMFNWIQNISGISVALPAIFELSGTEESSKKRLCHR